MWKVEKLAGSREQPMAVSGPVKGRVWLKVRSNTRRRAKAERVAMYARTDWQNANTIVRVRT